MNTLNDPSILRIEKVLDYIHSNVDKTLSLDELAKQSCWSRWQLQRVFQAKTGLNVAQYVRELKLSAAAQRILSSNDRMLDIALECGFNSEISFSRAFKQYFAVSPRQYKKNNLLAGIRAPLTRPNLSNQVDSTKLEFCQIRIEHRPTFSLTGLSEPIRGPFSPQPDFQQKVPMIWHDLLKVAPEIQSCPTQLGIIDTRHCILGDEGLIYWAGTASHHFESSSDKVTSIDIPDQTYAVLPVTGHISNLSNMVCWLMLFWLPDSGYQGVDGFELEVYDHRFNPISNDSYMEYWLPIEKVPTK
ncbi:AraC family transcriptional regulator [Vibrio sp. SCSIO 43136]|uniref:AraC family transcriptional regulator n=1 Tax=Vibrio sp. SCSIO 43136 TaxID=2819101 RepID=UPI00207548E5|nr:AraC family transcriptional regulator [Vibrio sp. SCSIO 43136]USD66052.1 AraC family transcriptional regulator [Vibrio sp. SCSIO 43136]